jgi:autotransporter-associated beta strand protein
MVCPRSSITTGSARSRRIADLSLIAANTYTGATLVNAGTLVVDNAALGGAATGTTAAPGATLLINGTGLSIAEPVDRGHGRGGWVANNNA